MLRPRIIPSLLVHKRGLVKTRGFKDPRYVGDPINAVKIFNEKEADELIVFDIDATLAGTEPDYVLIRKLAAECRMPLSYGGGVRTVEQVSRIVELGVEKVSVSAAALADPGVLVRMSEAVGRQSVVAVLDVRKTSGLFSESYELVTHNATVAHKVDPIVFARNIQESGVGEIVVNSVDRDGEMNGYDLDFARRVRNAVTVPLTLLGGAGSLAHMADLIRQCGIVGAAAGSLFVFKGGLRAVLISYPTRQQKEEIFQAALPPFVHTAR